MDGFKNGIPVIVLRESAEISLDTWKEKFYSLQNIFNMDETGCFWKVLPEKRVVKCVRGGGGKKSKLRLTIAFFVNALGDPNLRCFNKSKLPVYYYSQTKAWMTGHNAHCSCKVEYQNEVSEPFNTLAY